MNIHFTLLVLSQVETVSTLSTKKIFGHSFSEPYFYVHYSFVITLDTVLYI